MSQRFIKLQEGREKVTTPFYILYNGIFRHLVNPYMSVPFAIKSPSQGGGARAVGRGGGGYLSSSIFLTSRNAPPACKRQRYIPDDKL